MYDFLYKAFHSMRILAGMYISPRAKITYVYKRSTRIPLSDDFGHGETFLDVNFDLSPSPDGFI